MINKIIICRCFFLLMHFFQATNPKRVTSAVELGRECRVLFLCVIFSRGETLTTLTELLSAGTHSSGGLTDL